MLTSKIPTRLKSKFSFLIFDSSSVKGFTLIEMLVVFSLISVLAGLGIVSFANYSHTQEVNQAAITLRLLFNEARSNSLSSVRTMKNSSGTTVVCASDDQLMGYYIDVNVSSVSLYLNCRDAGGIVVKTRSLPQSVSYESKTCTQVRYDLLTSTASGTPCNVVILGFGIRKTINIDTGGIASIN